MKRSLLPLLLIVAIGWSVDVDLYGDLDWGWRTTFDKNWTPANNFNYSLGLGTRVHLDEGVRFEAELGSYSTVADSAGNRVRTPVYGGMATLSSTIEPDVYLNGLRALWTIVPGATIGVGDYEYTIGGVRHVDQWMENDFYSAVLSKRGVRGFILELSDFSGAIGVPWNDPDDTKDKSLTLYGQYNLTALDNNARSLILTPAVEFNIGHGRTRVWNFGLEFFYADNVGDRPYTFEGALGYLDVGTKPVWTFLAEPSISLGLVSLGGAFYFATLNGDNTAERQAELAELDMPVQMFASIEPMVALHRKVALGFPVVWNNPVVDEEDDEWSSAGLALRLWPTQKVASNFTVRYNKIYGAPDYWELDWRTYLSF